eukprot:530998-Prymnesium_polylepis.1
MVATVDGGVWCGDERGGLRLFDGPSTALVARHTAPGSQPLRHLSTAAMAATGHRDAPSRGLVWAAFADSTVQVWRVLER